MEDASHALGAKYKNEKVGSCKWSDMTVFSFHPVKMITTGEGGAIMTNNKKFDEKIDLLRSHGVSKTQSTSSIPGIEESEKMSQPSNQIDNIEIQQLESFIQGNNFNEEERDVLYLSIEGMSYAEISDIMGISAGNVGVIKCRTYKKLNEWNALSLSE